VEETFKPHPRVEEKGGRTGAIVGGLVLIWLGSSFYLAQTGLIAWVGWWAYFLSGLGVIVIIHGVIRYVESGYRHHLTGSLIGGSVLLAIGVTFIAGVRESWPMILIAVGAAMIASGVQKGRVRRP